MRRITWFPAIFALALIAGIWGVSQYRAKQALEIQAENQYARAFQELTYFMDGVETISAKALVSASRMQRVKDFADIWRNAYAAQARLGQLPLTNVPLKRTQSFLARVQAFTYDLGIDNLDETNKISEDEWQTLRRFHDQAQLLSSSLDRMSTSFTPSQMRWNTIGRDVAAAAVGGAGGPGQDADRLQQNPVVKSFVMIEDGLSRLPNPEFKGDRMNFDAEPKFITGPNISVSRARKVAAEFLGPDLLKGRRLVLYGRTSGKIPSYSFQAIPRKGRDLSVIQLDVTRKGGHVMWMLNQRLVDRIRYKLNTTQNIGLKFLESRGLGVIPVATQTFENIAIHSYATYYGGYVIYPELIKVQVARDNGEILGIDSVPYLTYHDPNRQVVAPAFDQQQAQKRVDQHLRMRRVRKAIIMNDQFQQVACYEFDGSLGKEGFRVYINTSNLDEEKVERASDVGYVRL